MKTRELTPQERAAIDTSYSDYCDTAGNADTITQINTAWAKYLKQLATLHVVATLAGYRVTL